MRDKARQGERANEPGEEEDEEEEEEAEVLILQIMQISNIFLKKEEKFPLYFLYRHFFQVFNEFLSFWRMLFCDVIGECSTVEVR